MRKFHFPIEKIQYVSKMISIYIFFPFSFSNLLKKTFDDNNFYLFTRFRKCRHHSRLTSFTTTFKILISHTKHARKRNKFCMHFLSLFPFILSLSLSFLLNVHHFKIIIIREKKKKIDRRVTLPPIFTNISFEN